MVVFHKKPNQKQLIDSNNIFEVYQNSSFSSLKEKPILLGYSMIKINLSLTVRA